MGQFANTCKKWSAKTKEQTKLCIQKIIIDCGSRIIMRTPVDTGLARGNWQASKGTIPSGSVMRFDNAEKAVNSLGTGVSSAKTDLIAKASAYNPLTEGSFFISNSLVYIQRLEYGYSKQAPSGMLRLTVAEFSDIFKNAVLSVRQFGLR